MSGVVNQFPVEKEYEKHPDISPEDIRKMREWLNTQPHLPGQHLTVETLGPWSRSAKTFYKDVTQRLIASTGDRRAGSFFAQRIGIAIQRGNAASILATIPRGQDLYCNDLDLFLTFYCCEKSAEVTKQVLDLHYTLRTLFTQLFKDRAVDHRTINVLNTVLLSPLPTPTVEGYRAVYCRLLDSDAKKFVFPDVIRTFMMIFDLWQYEEGTWPGFVIIIDMDTTTVNHIARLDIMTIRQILYFLQECMLVKLKEVHFLNAPYFMDKIMLLLKPFMEKALLDLIKIHESGSSAIYDYVPLKAFPKEFGGTYKERITIRDEIIRRLEDNKQFYNEENLRRVNESLRPDGKKRTVEDLFGIQGSFKKLDID